MPRAWIARACMAAWILGCASAAIAQNAISNGDFNAVDGTSGWTPVWATIWSFNAIDANNCELSGGGYGTSYPISDPERPEYFEVRAPGCLPLSPGQAMNVDFQYLAPGVAVVRALLMMYSSGDCTTGEGGFYFWNLGGAADWTRASLPFTNWVNAGSVRLEFDAWNTTLDAFQLLFDRVYLGAASRIFADDFEGGNDSFGRPCRWSASTP